MKLASLKHGRDGRLVVVSKNMTQCVEVSDIALTLQSALDDWAATEPKLNSVYEKLNNGIISGQSFDP
ncbi:MAG: 2-keto-4-pentenoate hydratase, partial [Pseudomonadota bacterium]